MCPFNILLPHSTFVLGSTFHSDSFSWGLQVEHLKKLPSLGCIFGHIFWSAPRTRQHLPQLMTIGEYTVQSQLALHLWTSPSKRYTLVFSLLHNPGNKLEAF